MGGKLRHLLIFLLIIMKELNVPEAGCSCEPSSPCRCTSMGLTSIPQNLPTSISMLDLDGNQITSIQAGSFTNLTRLKALHLHFNMITVIEKGAFASLSRLETLTLSFNQMTVIKSDLFVNLIRLRELWLDGNQITNIQLGALCYLSQLQMLNLCFNKITNIPSGLFSNLHQLQRLYIKYNKITMIQPCTFANLIHLKELRLDHNQITSIQSSALTNLTQLQELNLSYNKITMIDSTFFLYLIHMHKLVSLSINLYRNPWQCDCRMFYVRLLVYNWGFATSGTFIDRMICARPAKISGEKLMDADVGEMICDEKPTTSTPPVDVQETLKDSYNCAGSGHDSNLIGQDQPQAITEANFNTTATVVASVHGQPGQGQYQATTKSLVVKNPVYGPEPTAFKLSHLYNAECQGNSQADP
ncbi:slit homolog 2 protein-like [Branchiostoma floridae]|uniref:Slit homolog 2 protein-like n=1 Tax=Branchiostoma floridae TaxID=7739 RepID=A0A9J7M0W3_BRAFL|nr:slit homolog 2 protein-like [Branchiostoma floridae]